MADAPQHVRSTTEGPLAILTLDRPEARNAYSDVMLCQLVGALDSAAPWRPSGPALR
jgi:enoyl-CoA hydratase/carnithine racemase